jgi:hypothetical protein
MPTIFRECIVTLKNKDDLEQFYFEMENTGSGGFIPERAVQCANRRPISRNTHYYLTPDEAENIKNDPRVQSVSTPAAKLGIKTKLHSQTAAWSRGNNSIVGQKNWGLYRSTLSDNISGWGSESGASSQTATINITGSGKNVDVVVIDDIAYAGHTEFGGRLVQYDWFSQHDLEVRGTGCTITHVARTTGNATITTQTAHYINVGAVIDVICTSNGTFSTTSATVTAVGVTSSGEGGDGTTINTITYANAGATVGRVSASGTWTGKYQYNNYTGVNNHATHVAATITGSTQGWARDANVYNFRHDTEGFTSNDGDASGSFTPSQYVIDYVRAWHNSKSVNTATGVVNPTIVNNSWGLGTKVNVTNTLNGLGNSRFSKIRYRGTDFTATGIGEPVVDTGFSGVCTTTVLASALANISNGGNQIVTTSTSPASCSVGSISKVIGGRTGLTNAGAPTFISPDGRDDYDDSAWQITFPFQITFFGQNYGTGTSGNNQYLFVNTNSLVTFGGYGNPYTVDIGPGSPSARKICISAGDRSCQSLWTGVTGSTPNRTFRVRWEGHDAASGGVLGSPTMLWEMTFYEATAKKNQIDLHIDQNAAYRAEFTLAQLQDYGIMQSGELAPYRDPALDADIEDAVADGIIFVGSAGNGGFKVDVPGGTDYNNYFLDNGVPFYYHRGSTPANSRGTADANLNMISVGSVASTSEESKGQNSNTGPGVDIYAPGYNIMSGVYDSAGTTGTSWSGNDPVNDGSVVRTDLASVARSGNVATITTTAAHGLQTNDLVSIVCTGQTTFNTSMTLITRTGTNTFTYANTGTDLTTTLDTGVVTEGYLYQKYSGTSMSSAQVAGVLAIALETYPTMTQADAKTYILNYSKIDKMYETLGGFNDTTSLQGGENRFLFYNKERQDSGNLFPKTNYKIRPASGNVFPRPKIRRR